MEEATLISIILAYVVTGISITGYDFSTPPLHRKGYVIQKRYSIAILIWFIWPFTLLTDIRQEQLLYKRGFRNFIGVALGFFFWGKLLIVVFTKFTGNIVFSSIVSFVIMLLLSPFFGAITMPRFGGDPTFKDVIQALHSFSHELNRDYFFLYIDEAFYQAVESNLKDKKKEIKLLLADGVSPRGIAMQAVWDLSKAVITSGRMHTPEGHLSDEDKEFQMLIWVTQEKLQNIEGYTPSRNYKRNTGTNPENSSTSTEGILHKPEREKEVASAIKEEGKDNIPANPKNISPKNNFKSVLKALKDFWQELGVEKLPYIGDWFYEAVEMHLKEYKEVIEASLREGGSPRRLAMVGVYHVAGDMISSGSCHIYRGVLSGKGHDIKKIFLATLGSLYEDDFFSDEDVKENNEWLDEVIRTEG